MHARTAGHRAATIRSRPSRMLGIATVLAVAFATAPGLPADADAATSCVRIVAGVFDASGNDNVLPGLNREYVVVRNVCSGSVRLTGWRVRETASGHVYRFPAGFRIGAGVSVTLHSGTGRDDPNHLYWGRRYGEIWRNTPPEWAYLQNAAGTTVSTWSWPLARVVSHGSRTSKRIALTIDDGSPSSVCRQLVDILRRERVPATFFPVAANVVRSPGLWRGIAAQGFPIGNHTYSHPWLTRLGIHAQYDEIVRARRAVEATTGVPMIRVLRPTYGAYNDSTRRAARAAGFPTLLTWDTTFADTSSSTVSRQIVAGSRGTNGSVVLMHCRPNTPKVLGPVISAYRARGFTFVTVPQLLGIPGPVPSFPPRTSSAAQAVAQRP